MPKKGDSLATGEYRMAAEQGDALAQYNLGLKYENGEGVKKDINEAENWLHKAARQGYKAAQDELKKNQKERARVQRSTQRAAERREHKAITYENQSGQPCREFNTTAQISGRRQNIRGVACRESDGSWRAVK
jgi:TPR repeat protein